jgi:hypothetical protein
MGATRTYCKDCLWFDLRPYFGQDGETLGYCRIGPAIMMPSTRCDESMGRWPIVSAEDWCGHGVGK